MTELEAYKKTLEEVIKERDEARSEVEKLKDSVRAQTENANYWRDMYSKQGIGSRVVEKQSTPTCPEPSRLEIAADLLCVWESRAEITNVDTACKDALSIADTLIAAAKKEVQK